MAPKYISRLEVAFWANDWGKGLGLGLGPGNALLLFTNCGS